MQLDRKLLMSLTDLLVPELQGTSSICQHLAARLRSIALEIETQGQTTQSDQATHLREPEGHSALVQLTRPAVKAATEAAVQQEADGTRLDALRRSKCGSASCKLACTQSACSLLNGTALQG